MAQQLDFVNGSNMRLSSGSVLILFNDALVYDERNLTNFTSNIDWFELEKDALN